MVSIQVGVSQVFHCKTKHGVFIAVYSGGCRFLPVSSIVDVNVDGTTYFSVLLKVLGGSHHYVLPAEEEQREVSVINSNKGQKLQRRRTHYSLVPIEIQHRQIVAKRRGQALPLQDVLLEQDVARVRPFL